MLNLYFFNEIKTSPFYFVVERVVITIILCFFSEIEESDFIMMTFMKDKYLLHISFVWCARSHKEVLGLPST